MSDHSSAPPPANRLPVIIPPPEDTIPESERITLRPEGDDSDENDFWTMGGAA